MIQIKNNPSRYGAVAILLHWLVALGFLGTYIAVYYRHWFTDGGFSREELTPSMIALYLHLSIGITVGVFVLLRVIWKAMNPTPVIEAANPLEHMAAKWMHYVLYAIMIIMPVTGYLGTRLDTNFFFLFDIPKVNDTYLYQLVVEQWMQLTWKEFETVIDWIHKKSGAYLVWVLILLHAGAALYHHFFHKDDVLRNMTRIPKE